MQPKKSFVRRASQHCPGRQTTFINPFCRFCQGKWQKWNAPQIYIQTVFWLCYPLNLRFRMYMEQRFPPKCCHVSVSAFHNVNDLRPAILDKERKSHFLSKLDFSITIFFGKTSKENRKNIQVFYFYFSLLAQKIVLGMKWANKDEKQSHKQIKASRSWMRTVVE